MKSSDPIELSIIIPCRNSPELLNRCIESLSKYTQNLKVEIIVIDDFSRNPLVNTIINKKVKVIRFEKNLGPGAARNFGALESCGKYLFFVDSDVLIKQDTIKNLLERIKKNPNQVVQAIYEKMGKSTGLFTQFWSLFQGYKNIHIDSKSPTTISSYAFICTRELFLGSRGFNETLGPNEMCEDEEWSLRLKQSNTSLFIDKNTKVIHLHQYNFISYCRFQVLNTSSTLRLSLVKQKSQEQGVLSNRTIRFFSIAAISSVFFLLGVVLNMNYLVIVSLLIILLTQFDFFKFLKSESNLINALKLCIAYIPTGFSIIIGFGLGCFWHLVSPMKFNIKEM